MELVADDVQVVVLPNAGHWTMEEKPQETNAALLGFLQEHDVISAIRDRDQNDPRDIHGAQRSQLRAAESAVR